MHHVLSLHPATLSMEELDRAYAHPAVRAVATTAMGGDHGTMVFSQVESLAYDPPPGVGWACGLIWPWPTIPSPIPAGRVTTFGLVTLRAGKQRSYGNFLRGIAAPARGIRDGRALVVGLPDVHAIVEVVGEDLVKVADRLFSLTEHDDVVDVRTFVVPPERTRGFGVPLEDKPAIKVASGAKKAPKKTARTTR